MIGVQLSSIDFSFELVRLVTSGFVSFVFLQSLHLHSKCNPNWATFGLAIKDQKFIGVIEFLMQGYM